LTLARTVGTFPKFGRFQSIFGNPGGQRGGYPIDWLDGWYSVKVYRF
jgi:hypothetical protein